MQDTSLAVPTVRSKKVFHSKNPKGTNSHFIQCSWDGLAPREKSEPVARVEGGAHQKQKQPAGSAHLLVATSTTNTDQANKPKNKTQPKKQTPKKKLCTANYPQLQTNHQNRAKNQQQHAPETHKQQPKRPNLQNNHLQKTKI